MALNDGLVFDMPLTKRETLSTTVARDRTTNANNGTATGTPPIFDANGVELNGSSDYIVVADDSALSFTDGGGNDTAFTFAVWVNMDNDDGFRILSKGTGTEYEFDTGGADKLQIFLFTDGSNWISTVADAEFATQAGLNEWHHISVTYDGNEINSGLSIYVNGIVCATTDGSAGSYTGMANTANDMWIGRAASSYADGQMSNFKMWNRELTATEVLQVFNQGRNYKLIRAANKAKKTRRYL